MSKSTQEQIRSKHADVYYSCKTGDPAAVKHFHQGSSPISVELYEDIAEYLVRPVLNAADLAYDPCLHENLPGMVSFPGLIQYTVHPTQSQLSWCATLLEHFSLERTRVYLSEQRKRDASPCSCMCTAMKATHLLRADLRPALVVEQGGRMNQLVSVQDLPAKKKVTISSYAKAFSAEKVIKYFAYHHCSHLPLY